MSGVVTGGTINTMESRQSGILKDLPLALLACCGAVPGATIPGTVVARTVTATVPSYATAVLVFVWCHCLLALDFHRNPLPFYTFARRLRCRFVNVLVLGFSKTVDEGSPPKKTDYDYEYRFAEYEYEYEGG